MKLTAIMGSPHGMEGNTGKLLRAVIAEAEKAGATTTLFSLDETVIMPCVACDTCHRIGTCEEDDDFATVKAAMLDAEGIILASPNYMMSVTAQMKCLLDRCASPLHTQAFQGKYGAAVVTSGGPGGEEVEAYMLRWLRNVGSWTVGSVGADGGQMAKPETREQRLNAAGKLGRALVEAIQAKRRYPEQEAARGAFMERMEHLIEARKLDWPYEYEQLKKHKARVR